MRTREEIKKEIAVLQAELATLTAKYALATLVRFRDWNEPDDTPMNRIGKVIRHGRKWIEIDVEGKHAWAKADPHGAEPISLDQYISTSTTIAQTQSKPQQPASSEVVPEPVTPPAPPVAEVVAETVAPPQPPIPDVVAAEDAPKRPPVPEVADQKETSEKAKARKSAGSRRRA